MRGLVAFMTLLASAAPAQPVPKESLERFASLRVFFAHQSVGANIVEGVAALAAASSVPLAVTEDRSGRALVNPGLVHALVGQNQDPLGKLQDFEVLLDNGAAKADVAALKLCYVDFTSTTSAPRLFATYRAAVEAVHALHPGLRLLHVTAPLTTVQGGLKGWVKEKLGKSRYGAPENAARHAYNELLRAHFQGR